MSDTEPTLTERLADASKMGQEPKDRLWGALSALAILVMVLGGVVVFLFDGMQNYLEEGRLLADERGAIACATVFIDDEWNYGLTKYCRRPEVIIHYPPEFCDRYLPVDPFCGRDWDDG